MDGRERQGRVEKRGRGPTSKASGEGGERGSCFLALRGRTPLPYAAGMCTPPAAAAEEPVAAADAATAKQTIDGHVFLLHLHCNSRQTPRIRTRDVRCCAYDVRCRLARYLRIMVTVVLRSVREHVLYFFQISETRLYVFFQLACQKS